MRSRGTRDPTGRTNGCRQRAIHPLRGSSRGCAESLQLLLRALSCRSRAKKEGALLSRDPVEALRKPCVTHERKCTQTSAFSTSLGTHSEISQVSTVPIDAQNALILELSAGILPKFSASVRGKSKIPHFSRNRSAFLMGTGQTVPPFHIAERTQNLTRRQKNFPSFPLKPPQPPIVLLS